MQAARIKTAPLYVLVSALAAAALASSGCAGGAWLESPLQSELPIDPPKHGYPTAVRASLSDEAAPHAAPTSAPATPASVPDAASAFANNQPTLPTPSVAPPTQQRLDRHQPFLTPLAVIPQQYVRQPANAPPQPATVAVPSPPPASETTPSPSVLPSSWSPSAIWPQFEASLLDSTTIWQPPQPAPTATAIAATTASTESDAIKSDLKAVAHESNDSPADRHAKVERARSELIEALEAEIRQRRGDSTSDEELPRLEQQLRLAYVASGRMEDAVAAIESLDLSQREAYKDLMFGLGVWLSPDEARRASLRSAKVLRSLRDATSDLAAASKLEVRNLVFCERVDHFGWYSEFPRKEFQPKQQVILYAEVDNFAAEQKGPAGYETELQGSYEILDSSGQIVASRQLQLDKEICRNYRRDYFLAYRIYMPDNLPPGRYRLELTVEDLKARSKYQGRKLGDGMIEFTIR